MWVRRLNRVDVVNGEAAVKQAKMQASGVRHSYFSHEIAWHCLHAVHADKAQINVM